MPRAGCAGAEAMGRIAKYTRRGFLIGSFAVAGGVGFGVWEKLRVLPNPLAPEGGGVALNPYLIIAPDGISVIAPRAEMGQGVQSTLAALVAEELDVDPAALTVLHGPPAQTYYNAALLAGHATYRDQDAPGLFGALAASAREVLPKMLSLQVTGGSTSTVDGFEKMRLAGATARETLKLAAAARLGAAAGTLRTRAGAVIAPDGAALPYGELAADAAGIETPRGVELRPRSAWRYLGRDVPRADTRAKSTGTAMFGADQRLPGMRFATVRMSPRLGAGMVSFDASAAENMPGVERVLDLGDGIAVVASNTWLAFQAAEAVDIQWQEAPYPETTEGLFRAVAAALDGEPNLVVSESGDIAAAGPGDRISAEYRVPYLAHATMEPMNATAWLREGRLDIWCGIQAPLLGRDKAAAAVGLDAADVTVHVPFLGGGFGRRTEPDAAVLAARVAAAMPGVPVKVMWSREEDMRHDFYRPAAVARMTGVVRDGRAVMLDAHIGAASVTKQSAARAAGFTPPGPDRLHLDGAIDQPYAIANTRFSGYLADVAVPVGYWRSVAASFNGFFHECFVDELAIAAGADPLAFRLDMVSRADAASARVLETVARMSDWQNRPEGVGRGVAFTWSFGTPVAEVVEVARSDEGIRITRAWVACDVGIALNPRNIRAQMQSALIYGLSAAVHGEITFDGGEVEQFNFPDYDALRIGQAPEIEVEVLENNARMGGVGEPGTPPSMPALANALFDLTGVRARELPLANRFDFAF